MFAKIKLAMTSCVNRRFSTKLLSVKFHKKYIWKLEKNLNNIAGLIGIARKAGYVVIGGEKGEGCFSTSPSMIKDVPECASSNTNSNPNENLDEEIDDEDTISVIRSYNEYLLTKIYKIIILSLIILY